METLVKEALLQAKNSLDAVVEDQQLHKQIVRAAELICQSLNSGGRIYSCGNGGSMCDAMHFAEEMTGRFRENRPAMAAQAISDPSHMSCVSNDFGYEFVFSRYIEAFAGKNDVLLGISTSGTSKNIIRAFEAAHTKGCKIIGMTGKSGTPVAEKADVALVTPGCGKYADRVQELHIKVIHILIELTEHKLFNIP